MITFIDRRFYRYDSRQYMIIGDKPTGFFTKPYHIQGVISQYHTISTDIYSRNLRLEQDQFYFTEEGKYERVFPISVWEFEEFVYR